MTDVGGLGGTFGGRVVIDPVALARLMDSPHGPVARELVVAGEIVKEGAKRRVGVDTGRLRDSIVKRVVTDVRGVAVLVGSEVEYAVWHHEGTEDHDIRPINAKALSFEWRGRRVFFAKVHHPGTDPNRFLTDSIADLRARY